MHADRQSAVSDIERQTYGRQRLTQIETLHSQGKMRETHTHTKAETTRNMTQPTQTGARANGNTPEARAQPSEDEIDTQRLKHYSQMKMRDTHRG
jgi:hypothetical protein